jgi:hypothetical protein
MVIQGAGESALRFTPHCRFPLHLIVDREHINFAAEALDSATSSSLNHA